MTPQAPQAPARRRSTSATAAAKRCLAIARQWGNERVQWGRPVGKHDAVAQKIGAMAADTFALEAVADLCSLLADKGGAAALPLVVRLDGNNADLGRSILRDAGNPLVELVDTMDDAARRVAQLAAQGA